MKRTWLLLVLLAAAVPAAAADMYSWTDANGVKHFSDSPPPQGVAKAQKLKVKGGVTSNAEEAAATADTSKNSGPALAAAAGYSADDIKRNCDIATKNVATLQGQHVAVDAQGNPVDAEAEKSRLAQIDKANQQIKLFCGKH